MRDIYRKLASITFHLNTAFGHILSNGFISMAIIHQKNQKKSYKYVIDFIILWHRMKQLFLWKGEIRCASKSAVNIFISFYYCIFFKEQIL